MQYPTFCLCLQLASRAAKRTKIKTQMFPPQNRRRSSRSRTELVLQPSELSEPDVLWQYEAFCESLFRLYDVCGIAFGTISINGDCLGNGCKCCLDHLVSTIPVVELFVNLHHQLSHRFTLQTATTSCRHYH
jgi:hypothetical protein